MNESSASSYKGLAIIPARRNSKRIPGKNVKFFRGKPMISWIIEALQESEQFSEIHVSTDCEIAKQVASDLGLPPAFPRPASLADDNTALSEVLLYVINEYANRGHKFNFFGLFLPTAVFLKSSTIVEACDLFTRSESFDKMMSVKRFPVPVEWAMKCDESGALVPKWPSAISVKSQDLDEAWYETGEFVLYRSFEAVLDASVPITGFITSHLSVDIDEPEDWDFAETLGELIDL